MEFWGFLFLLYSECMGGYKEISLGFIWDILETLEKMKAWRSRGFAEFSGLFFSYLYIHIHYGYFFIFLWTKFLF